MILGPVISGWLTLHVPLSVPFWLVACCCLIAMVVVMGMQNKTTYGSSGSIPILESKDSEVLSSAPADQTSRQEKIAQEYASNNTQSRPSNGTGPISVPLTGYITVHVLEMSAYAVFLTYFALYATQIMQWDTFSASLAFTIAGISTLAAAPFVGFLSDRLADRLLMCMLGMFLIGVEVIVFLSTSVHLWVHIGMFVGGIGGACYMDSFFAHIGDHTPEVNRSSVIGKIVSSAEIGSMVSPLLAALLMETLSLYAVFVLNLILIAAAIAVQGIMRSKYRMKER